MLLPPRFAQDSPGLLVVGATLVAAGEAIRLWGVRHIGVISRTRSTRLGPLVASGPFAIVRNPLYVGNIVLWVGFAVSARLLWLAPIFIAVLALQYHAIVRWEEQLLEARLGDTYRTYIAQVPRWLPTFKRPSREAGGWRAGPGAHDSDAPLFSWRETFYSERGTLTAIALGYALLYIKGAALDA